MPNLVIFDGNTLKNESGTVQVKVASRANTKSNDTKSCFFIKKISLIPTAAKSTVSQSIQRPPANTIGINKIKAITAVITRCFILTIRFVYLTKAPVTVLKFINKLF